MPMNVEVEQAHEWQQVSDMEIFRGGVNTRVDCLGSLESAT